MSETIWTEEDLARLKEAVASGILTVSYSGPPARTVTYQNLAEMRKLLAEMRGEVNGAPRTRYAAFRKGL